MRHMLQSFDDLFARFGGVREFAEAIDLKYSTVVAFKTRGSIPMEHWKKIESAAKLHDIEGVDRHSLTEMLIARFPDVEPSKRRAERVQSTTPLDA